MKYFLGIEVARGPQGLFLCHRKYALKIINEGGLLSAKPTEFPIEENHKLTLANGRLLKDATQYHRLVGKLTYLTITHPDLVYVIHILSQFMQAPREEHMDVACRVLRYLKGTAGFGLLLPANNDMTIYSFYDSDCGTCLLSGKSLTGYFIRLGALPIS